MDILGLPENIHSFTLCAGKDRFPTVTVTFDPEETPYTGVATKHFQLVELPDDQVR